MRSVLCGLASVAVLGSSVCWTAAPQAKVDFTKDIRPILNAHCIKCHEGPEAAAGLSLDTLANVLKGDANGKVVLLGQGERSLIVERLQGKLSRPAMPLGASALTPAEIDEVRRWIDLGCPDSSNGKAAKHWAYVAPVKPPVPRLNSPWIRSPIDAFVLQKLRQKGLSPSPEADRVTLIRRLSLDLIGLPPTPQEVDAFIADRSKDAYEKVVDRVLANPHYGERMALPWLDAARYADSNGFQMDGDNYQYVWRDWLVKALNANMPFDEFTIDQLAGDLLPHATRDQIVATAFNRNHMLNGEGGAIPEEQRNVGLFDRVDATATTWLGLTMTCSRCHDHKYDPFKQRDYYSLMAFFNNLPETGLPTDNDGRHFYAKPWIEAPTAEQSRAIGAAQEDLGRAAADAKAYEEGPAFEAALAKWEQAPGSLPKATADILQKDPAKRSNEDRAALRTYYLDNLLPEPGKTLHQKHKDAEARLAKLKAEVARVMVMADTQPRKTFIYSRGNYDAPLQEVHPDTPWSLPPMLGTDPKNRLGLARWIVSPYNPLTARVQVNWNWQIFFGKGLVRTPENFGVQGEPPTHPELLDWLAVDFREHGWNVKRLQKMIVMSSTYRQSSKVSPRLREVDPDNRLLARGARFRLPSMLLRDLALSASGLLNPAIGGPPVYPYQPKGIWDSLNITDERDFSYPQSKGTDLYRRSLYTFWRRTVGPGDMFDASTRQVCTVRPSQTSTPMHALIMLNDVAWVEAGRALAQDVMVRFPSEDDRLREAFRRVCARRPDSGELAVLRRALGQALSSFRNDPKRAREYLSQGEFKVDPKLDPGELAAYAAVCSAVFNLDEAMTRE